MDNIIWNEKHHCICNNNKFDIVSTVDRYNININTLLCRNCGLILLNKNIQNVDYYYNNIFYNLSNTIKMVDDNDIILLKDIEPYISKESKILDFGSGSGELINRWNNNRFNIQKYDLIDKITLSEKYDIIILNQVLDHIQDFDSFFYLMNLISNENSLLYIRVNNILNIHLDLRYTFNIEKYITHYHNLYFTKETLIFFMNLFGYETIFISNQIHSIFKKTNKKIKTENQYYKIKSYLDILRDSIEDTKRYNKETYKKILLNSIDNINIKEKLWNI